MTPASLFRPKLQSTMVPPVSAAVAAPVAASVAAARPVPAPAGERSLDERMAATFRRGEEALSPRELRQLLEQLQGIVDPRVSEVEGGRRAAQLQA